MMSSKTHKVVKLHHRYTRAEDMKHRLGHAIEQGREIDASMRCLVRCFWLEHHITNSKDSVELN
jgi:hypothetical protein